MEIYTATVNAVAVSAAQDIFEIVTPATTRAVIREIRIGQYSDAGDSQAELLSVLIIRGYTVSGSGGSTPTPLSLYKRSTGTPTSACTVEANNTTVANTGTAEVLFADTWNVQTPFIYKPDTDERLRMDYSQRVVVRITAPSDSITLNATLVYEESPV